MKENKTYQLKVRLTNREKELLQRTAAEQNTTISEFVRAALYKFIGGYKNDK